MDYSEFDALPSKTDEISISEEPSHDGIRDMPSLEKAGEIFPHESRKSAEPRQKSRTEAASPKAS